MRKKARGGGVRSVAEVANKMGGGWRGMGGCGVGGGGVREDVPNGPRGLVRVRLCDVLSQVAFRSSLFFFRTRANHRLSSLSHQVGPFMQKMMGKVMGGGLGGMMGGGMPGMGGGMGGGGGGGGMPNMGGGYDGDDDIPDLDGDEMPDMVD